MARDDEEALAIRLGRELSFRLGDVEVHPATRQIVRDGRSETLEPRIMQVLVAFARAEGAILGYDELIERCWNGRIVGENAIHRAISKVRDLGLHFGGGTFAIETITKVGYRMSIRGHEPAPMPEPVPEPVSGPVPGPVEAPSASPAGSHDREPQWHPSRRSVIGAGVAASVAGAVGLGYHFLRPDPVDARVANLVERSDQALRNALPEKDVEAVGFLERAVALRPESAFAWGRLALAREIVAEHAPPAEATAAVNAAVDAARRALEIDRRQIDALAALALLPPYYGDWLAADRRMESVLRLDPGNLAIRNRRSFMYVGVGRAREGSADRLLTAALEPLHAGQQSNLVYAYWILGDIGAADRAADRALQLWPRHPSVWLARLWTLACTDRATRALAHVEDQAGRPDFPPWMFEALHMAMAAMVSRRPDDVAAAVTAVLSLVSRGPSNSISAVVILCALGEVDRAYEVSKAYLLERGPLMASVRWRDGQVSINDEHRRKTNMLFIPVAEAMRADQRFLDLTTEIGLKSYWQGAGVLPDFLRKSA
jgi:DNA-binding winged helix-turn-helix (wHTH) protein/tetratricopeptide (TPR) repeat protein